VKSVKFVARKQTTFTQWVYPEEIITNRFSKNEHKIQRILKKEWIKKSSAECGRISRIAFSL